MAKSNEVVVNNASNIIARQVAQMATLVEDLLDVSRVTRGAIELKLEPLDLRQLIADAVEQVTPQVQARHHALAVAELPQAITLLGDKKRLIQVITNLLTNAAKYTPEHGHIGLSLEVYGDQLAIAVEDNGVGMAPDFVPHIFDLFTQAECTSDRTSGGLGKGSKFTVWLPRQAVDESRIERRRAPRMDLSTAKKLRIMVVDDNIDGVEMLATLLEAAGHEVFTASRGREALDRSKEVAPDVFLLDIGLPDMDGNELARYLRTQAETNRAVLIAWTGYGMGGDRAQTSAAGFDHHLVKPVNAEMRCGLLGKVQPAQSWIPIRCGSSRHHSLAHHSFRKPPCRFVRRSGIIRG